MLPMNLSLTKKKKRKKKKNPICPNGMRDTIVFHLFIFNKLVTMTRENIILPIATTSMKTTSIPTNLSGANQSVY
jgi:hypothetical protein